MSEPWVLLKGLEYAKEEAQGAIFWAEVSERSPDAALPAEKAVNRARLSWGAILDVTGEREQRGRQRVVCALCNRVVHPGDLIDGRVKHVACLPCLKEME